MLPTWDNEPTNSRRRYIVEGHPRVWDGTLRPEAVPNVIIVGCGFTQAERALSSKRSPT